MPIKLDDPNALEQLTEKLSKRRQLQEMMKEVNAVIRSSKSDDAKIDFIMKKCGKSREEARNFLHPSENWCAPGFAAWELANNNQEIGRLRKRIREVERYREAAAKAEEEGSSEFPFDGGRIVDNVPANRLQIFFDEKPDADVRTRLKQNGFRWAPNSGAWQSTSTGIRSTGPNGNSIPRQSNDSRYPLPGTDVRSDCSRLFSTADPAGNSETAFAQTGTRGCVPQ